MATLERAELGVDGNCGFALLGEDLQVGEAEFVVIDSGDPKWTANWEAAAGRASTKAYRTLRDRLGGVYRGKPISWVIGPSHPLYL